MTKKNKSVHKKDTNNYELHPRTLAIHAGYVSGWSEGAAKPPIFMTSTWVPKNARKLELIFKNMHAKNPKENFGLAYSRVSHAGLEILEKRLRSWNKEKACAVFDSGMAAIERTLRCFLKPGDFILYSEPLYGGTINLIKHGLAAIGIHSAGFPADSSLKEMEYFLKKSGHSKKLAIIIIEPPANPTIQLVDIESCAYLALKYSEKKKVLLAVDNIFLGPLWQNPDLHGADLTIYSATKYLGGHSDLIAGAVLGDKNVINPLRDARQDPADAFTAWLLLRSLETLELRMEGQMNNAIYVANYLRNHPKVRKTRYLGLLKENDPQYITYQKQCTGVGAMISFEIKGGKQEAFAFLDALKIFQGAVSLGGTESLASHPASTTHSNLSAEERKRMEIGQGMIRLSLGLEYHKDLIFDLEQAFKKI